MANKRITMSKVRQILRLHSEGKTKLQISELCGSSRNTVKKYLRVFEREQYQWTAIEAMNDFQLSQLFCVDETREPSERLRILNALFPSIEKSLKRRGMTYTMQWAEYLLKHPDGFKFTSFCCYLNRYLNQTRPVMHIEHKAGDKMFIDFAGEKMHYWSRDTGEQIAVEIFAAILGCSQLVYVEAVASQKKEDLIRGCENAIQFYGGVPAALVPDNLKSAVTKSSKYEPTLNETFEDFASHYNTTVLPARSYRPRDKALVEGIVKIIYTSIYTTIDKHDFFSLEELNAAIKMELEKLNNKTLTGRNYSRRQQFEELEKQALRALPQYGYNIKKQYVCTVMKNGFVCLRTDKHYYSVPYRLIGKKIKILYTDNEVEIFHQYNSIALHTRDMRPHQYTVIKDHLASAHQFITEWSIEKFITDAKKIHDDVAQYIWHVIASKNHPEAAYKSCMGILNFGRKVGNERLINACRRAERFQLYGYPQIENILQRKLDLVKDDEENNPLIPPHPNIRGSNYYQ